MSKKLLIVIFLIIFTIIFALAFLFLAQKTVKAPTKSEESTKSALNTKPSPSSPNFTGNEDAFKNALNLYIQKKKEGLDMTNGPCLGKVADDWVLDIAHNPRQPIDDLPQNQCADYTNGKAHHYIELDPDGKLITSH